MVSPAVWTTAAQTDSDPELEIRLCVVIACAAREDLQHLLAECARNERARRAL
ncbi:hypothetical protein JYU34_009923 [Plutella xylostella]|uniref:Uncharacterized protein n=1 Tax=Plutella xylostella TaxID=51655 RepID=A0ABQ7QKL5_PLUXY|nr:hypothetical protein JYU34_009923 [Plutella xylostella]